MNALELHGVQKTYPGFTLGPIDLTLPGGTVCGLIGENGAGKSTTLKLILGILPPESGTIRVLGKDDLEASPCTKEDIGVVLSGDGIPTCLTAEQMGKVMAGIYRNWDAGVYAGFCKRFELPAKKKYNEYSTGMKMKLCLAVALSHHPKLLLLDEATSGLDPVIRDELIDLLLDLCGTKTTPFLSRPTLSVIWKSSATPLPSCTRAGSYSARTRTPCGKNTPSGTAPPLNWKSWLRTSWSASGSHPTGPKRWSNGTGCPLEAP